MPNDYARYPEDAPEQMKRFAEQHNSVPYVVDETQAVAPTTRSAPPIFGFNAALAVPWPACVTDHARPRCPPGTVRGDVPDRRDRQGTGGAAAQHGLLDEVAGVVTANLLDARRGKIGLIPSCCNPAMSYRLACCRTFVMVLAFALVSDVARSAAEEPAPTIAPTPTA